MQKEKKENLMNLFIPSLLLLFHIVSSIPTTNDNFMTSPNLEKRYRNALIENIAEKTAAKSAAAIGQDLFSPKATNKRSRSRMNSPVVIPKPGPVALPSSAFIRIEPPIDASKKTSPL